MKYFLVSCLCMWALGLATETQVASGDKEYYNAKLTIQKVKVAKTIGVKPKPVQAKPVNMDRVVAKGMETGTVKSIIAPNKATIKQINRRMRQSHIQPNQIESGRCTDCQGNDCTGYESWVGDGWCDDGAYGFYFDCDEFNCDEGDCDCGGEEPPACEFLDCQGQEACGYESWIGDGWCDDGAYGLYFDCDEFNCDEGDCDCGGRSARVNNTPELSTDHNMNIKNLGKRRMAFALRNIHAKSLIASAKTMVHGTPDVLDIATNEVVEYNTESTRSVSYVINVYCDDCNEGEAWEGSWDTNEAEFLVYGFVPGSYVCANVVAVSTDLGSTVPSAEACAYAPDEAPCEFFDCIGQEACGYESWVGDGYCDDGEWGMYFNCDEFDNDGGDCAPACENGAGDVNSDGNVNVSDIVQIVNHILGSAPFSDECALGAADYNADGNINVSDIVQVVNYILGSSARADGSFNMQENTINGINVGGIQVEGNLVSEVDGSDIVASENGMTIIYNMSGTLETKSFTFDNISNAIVVNGAGEVLTSSEVSEFGLSAAYPNPFNPSTTVQLTLPEAGYVSVQVYNLAGQVVATLANGVMNSSASLTWNAVDASSGVYFVRAEYADQVTMQKVMLLK